MGTIASRYLQLTDLPQRALRKTGGHGELDLNLLRFGPGDARIGLMANDEGHLSKKKNVDYQFYATILFIEQLLLN